MSLRRLLLLSSRRLHLHPPFPPPAISPAPFLCSLRSLSSAATATAAAPSDIARTVSDALSKISAASSPSLDLADHFSLHFADASFNTRLLSEVLDVSPAAGRSALDLYHYLVRQRGFTPNDLSLSHMVHYFGRRHDFKAVEELFSAFPRSAGPLSISAAVERLARSGRPTQAVAFFEDLEKDLGIKRSLPHLKLLVTAFADHKFPGHAERTVKKFASEIFPDEEICNELIRGWCSDLKLDEARRLAGEIVRGGFELGTPAYNSILDCICRLCRKKDPVRTKQEADKFLAQMEADSIPRNAETFNVLIYNFCKIRKTEDALSLFRRMGEWNCSPDAETYLTLIKSLYQAARVSEGDEMITWMRSAGFGKALDRKAYYGFVKILCGIERVDHAMKVFRMMKGYGHAPGVKTYDLLIGKLAEHNQIHRANALFKEAVARGVPVVAKVYKLNPRFVKTKEKKGKKRETLPEKMKKKRRRLKRLQLSFVRKPKSSGRRRFIS